MFILIQSHQKSKYNEVLNDVFRLRKKVFIDELEWDIPARGDCEIDHYDNSDASYLVWLNPRTKEVYGSVRLISTVQPTLLHDVFYATHNCDDALIDPRIFEGTRLCIDAENVARDYPDIGPARGMQMMLLALCEAALAFGIERLVSNFEAPFSRLYQAAGLKYHLHGKAHGYGRRPVYSASFEVTKDVLKSMRAALGVHSAGFQMAADNSPIIPASEPGEYHYQINTMKSDISAAAPLDAIR